MPSTDLGQLLLGDGLLLLFQKHIQLLQSGRVEQMVARFPKNQAQFRIVREHLTGLGFLFAQIHERVDVLDGLVRLLPELHRYGVVQLQQTGLQVVVLGLGLGEIDGGHCLVRVLVALDHVLPERLAQLAELGLALVFDAKREGLFRHLLIQRLDLYLKKINNNRQKLFLSNVIQPCCCFLANPNTVCKTPTRILAKGPKHPGRLYLGTIRH